MEDKKVIIGGVEYVPVTEQSPEFKASVNEKAAAEIGVVLEIIQSYVDNGRELLKDFDEADLKISHVEAEGFTRAAVSIFEHVEEYRRNFTNE